MTRRLAVTWAFDTVALYVAVWLLPGVSYGDDWWVPLLAGLVFMLVNIALKPLLTILSIPFIIFTLGFFYLLINVFMIYLTHWIVPHFHLSGFWQALLAALIVSLVNWVLSLIFGDPKRPPRRSDRRPVLG